jgi:Tol biopolymer transport system component
MNINRVSVDSAGNQANDVSFGCSISADGRFVAFSSYASNLVPGDTDNRSDIFVPGDTDNRSDIFVRDLSTNTTTLVSASSNGDRGDKTSGGSSISAGGRFVALILCQVNSLRFALPILKTVCSEDFSPSIIRTKSSLQTNLIVVFRSDII